MPRRPAALALAAATIAVAAILAAGCGKKAEQAAAPTNAISPPQPSQAAQPAQPAPEKKYRIAVVPKGTAHVFWKTVEAGARAAGEKFGAEILWNGPSEETDVAGQISIIEDFITQGVDALVMAACDADALVPVVRRALKKGIPVITIDSGISTDDALCFVATDNIEAAKKGAEKLAELIGGKGKVGLLPFIKGAATSDWREQGFREGIKKYPGIEIASVLYTQSDAAVAMQKTEDMLTAVPDLAGIFACNEPGVVGAAQVLRQRNLAGKVKLVGFDASDAEIQALKDGVVQALIVQNPFRMGYDGVRMAIKAIRGEEIPKRIDTGVMIVTPENFNEPEVQRWLFPLEHLDELTSEGE